MSLNYIRSSPTVYRSIHMGEKKMLFFKTKEEDGSFKKESSENGPKKLKQRYGFFNECEITIKGKDERNLHRRHIRKIVHELSTVKKY